MIQALSNRFRPIIAALLSLVIYVQMIIPLRSFAAGGSGTYSTQGYLTASVYDKAVGGHMPLNIEKMPVAVNLRKSKQTPIAYPPNITNSMYFSGGPSQPEATSFKPVGADNLVNLFTGDFSYTIPLLDVDGYPVNLFYNGGITMEQEASWVGLGWNINPGSVSRNMRGVPDDFNGTDTLLQSQAVKPNKTWGGTIGWDGELLGIKQPNLNFNLGFSYNNYLGPSVELGAGISVSIPITQTQLHEKSAPLDSSQGLNLSLGASAKLSSRSGLTLSPSLNAGLHSVTQRTDLGVGLTTSYNSRTGIKDLNINSQASMFRYDVTKKGLPVKIAVNQGLTSSSITFARPSYIPTLRMPMQYANYSGQVELGTGMFGVRGAATAQGYYSVSQVADGADTILKPLVGYMYLQNAVGRKDAVMDFNRLNDGEVTPNTPVISAPVYDYDVFSVQGEGTGGSIRAYRGDLGFMRDNETISKDKNLSLGFDIAPPGHYGGNWNTISSPTRSGGWDDANNTLNQTLNFDTGFVNNPFEYVYFRNPGETTVTNDSLIKKIGQDNLVRFKLSGSSVSPRLESQLEQFNNATSTPLGTLSLAKANAVQPRDKRTQVITMLTANEASRVGLDTSIRNYSAALDASNNLQYANISRVGGYRKGHHISEIDVLEQSGMRYVYGLPVYNKVQKDFTFSASGVVNATTNLVTYSANEASLVSDNITKNRGYDGYFNMQQTPAYASAFLITALLSPDYVDVTGNGITEDDLGSAVKFNYSLSPGGVHRWRTPRGGSFVAHFNAGLKTEKRDDKASFSYGEREAWYMHSIESKAMIAIFKTSPRTDGKGVLGDINGTTSTIESVNLKLDSILLYTKSDIKANGLAKAVPLKTVHFDYSYALCNGTPDNSPSAGKLTLTDIYFTYNGQSRASKNLYVFNYGNLSSNLDNAAYAVNYNDRWGTYKPAKDSTGSALNPNGLSNIDYPYTLTNKQKDDQYAGEWSLKKILLPSGGQIEVQYEADDYAYVQDRRACNMYSIYGFGTGTSYAQSNMLYNIFNNTDQMYVYIQLPTALQNTDPVKQKKEILANYLDGIKQLAFKLNINMPKGMEPLTVYAGFDDYGLCSNSNDRKTIYIKLTAVNGKSPLANASVRFLIDQLPGQAFPGYDMSDETGIEAFFDLVASELSGLENAFKNADAQMRSIGNGSSVSLVNSFIRLNSPFFKYGGGHRVKRLLVKDNWNALSGQYTSQYGQDYDYTTTANINGVSAAISSGVASYEPGIGSEENPFREILQFQDKLPLASAQYGAIEMPVLEGLYPSPVVGYSKVTVRSINRNGTQGSNVVKSAVGRQVTEFFTAKDFPSYSVYTPMSTLDYHDGSPFSFFYKETIDRRTTSQGFLVETNDMHGKLKSQSAYSETDSLTPLSYTYHTYKNTGANGLNDKVDFVHNELGGTVVSGNMGIDMELMTDVREFSVTSNGYNGQVQTDFFTFVPWPIFGVFMYPLQSYTENKYRAVTTTKLINFHAIEDSVIVNDKGSTVSSKAVAYDAETGLPVISQTMNEYNSPVYNTSYPAYWGYGGMGPAYKNIGAVYKGISFLDGVLTTGIDKSIFESGDELLIIDTGTTAAVCNPAMASPFVNRIWVFDKNKNTTSLTTTPSLFFMDSTGKAYSRANVTIKILRSGKRNMLSAMSQTVSSGVNPVYYDTATHLKRLAFTGAQVINASAVEYKEKWKADAGVIKSVIQVPDKNNPCSTTDSIACGGLLESKINPYCKGLLGNFRSYRSLVFYAPRAETNPAVNTNIQTNGYLSTFKLYWDFNSSTKNLVPDSASTKWVWNKQSTRVNIHGLETEDKNALNIFSTAQYGYNKTLPIAITENAAYSQAVYEGFEDSSYTNAINKSTYAGCAKDKYFDLSGMLNSGIINTDAQAFSAHTGRYVLQVNASSTASTSIGLSNGIAPDYALIPSIKKENTPVNRGGTHSVRLNAGALADSSFTFDSSYVMASFMPYMNSSVGPYSYFSMTFNTYIVITQPKVYNFNLAFSSAFLHNPDGSFPLSNAFDVAIYDANGALVKDTMISYGSGGCSASSQACGQVYSTFLCPGVYRVAGSATENMGGPNGFSNDSHTTYTWSMTNYRSATYKDTVSVVGCTHTVPIAGSADMINQSFAIPDASTGKEMMFSAWVHKLSTNSQGVFDSNQVQLQFLDVNQQPVIQTAFGSGGQQIGGTRLIDSLVPSGPVIDGWQRYEGYFMAPANASTVSLGFVNKSSQPIYFDDIRIHPYNANMKSYVYDPRTLRLNAELDGNNYATFYDYDDEGRLVRVKKETARGIKTIQETRSALQKGVKTIQ